MAGYMPNQVNNTREYFNCNFKCIFIAKITANVLYEATYSAKPRVLLLSSEDFAPVKMVNFSARHRFQRADLPLYGADLFNKDHLIECLMLLYFRSQMYLDRTLSCECLQYLNADTLWLLYRDLNACSVMPMYEFLSSLVSVVTVAL